MQKVEFFRLSRIRQPSLVTFRVLGRSMGSIGDNVMHGFGALGVQMFLVSHHRFIGSELRLPGIHINACLALDTGTTNDYDRERISIINQVWCLSSKLTRAAVGRIAAKPECHHDC